MKCLKDVFEFKSSCQDPSFCCGARDFSPVLVDCGDIMSFNLTKVTRCACGSCTEKVAVVQGIVVGGQQEKAIRYGEVIYNSEVVASTDRKGKFSFTIPGKVKRAIVTFKDSVYAEFEEKNKIFEINEGSSDFHKIKLKVKPSPIAFNTLEPLDILLGSDPSDSFADLEVPKETFITEDGSVYKGNAKAIVSVTDSRNISDILNAPGDFTTTDEEGEVEMLETYGMVKMSFVDENGKKLAMSKPMKVFLDPEKLNITVKNSSDVRLKLYWLDKKTQRWREVSNFQLEDGSKRKRKRSNRRVFLVATLTPAIPLDQTLNFDLPHKRVAVRVVAEKKDGTGTVQRVAGVRVSVLKKESIGYGGYGEKTTDNYGVACIPIWRDAQCTIQAEYKGTYGEPIKMDDLPNSPSYDIDAKVGQKQSTDEKTRVQWIDFKSLLIENSDEDSPIYSINNDSCKSQSRPEAADQFTFKVPQTDTEFTMLTVYNRNDWDPRDCYIKVKINGENAIFAAESYKGDDVKEGKLGLHLQMSKTVTAGGSNIVCLQFSCPEEGTPTYVKIAPLTKSCTFKPIPKNAHGLHHDLSVVQYPCCPDGIQKSDCQNRARLPEILGEEKWVWVPKSTTGQSYYRTFRGPHKGKARCLIGDQGHQQKSTDTIKDGGWALEYQCR